MKGDKGGEGLKEGVWTDRDKEMRRGGGNRVVRRKRKGKRQGTSG